MTSKLKTERTRLRRKPERGSHDPKDIHAILDAMPLCHIAYLDQFGKPAIIPTLQWREGNHVYWHASNGARSLKAMAGQQIALSVTLMDGFVMARSAMNHSMNYRSAILYGEAFNVEGAKKVEKLKNMIEAYFPGRWAGLRPITETELKQTAVLGMEIDEASTKCRASGVGDDEEDLNWPLWSGIIPISLQIGEPIDDENNQTGTEPGSDIKSTKIG